MKKTLLIANNSVEELNPLGKKLRNAGYNILIAQNGEQALGIIEHKLPHILLVYDNLGDMSVSELLTRINSKAINPGLKIVAILLELHPVNVDKLHEQGVNLVVDKLSIANNLVLYLEQLFQSEAEKLSLKSSASKETKKRGLLVEDNQLNQNYILAIMDELAIEMDLSDNAELAFEMIKQQNYDLILTDINLPGMSGIELTHLIRAESSLEVPIIGISGHSGADIIASCLEAGINAIVTKPFTGNDLKEEVLHWLPLNTSSNYAPAPEVRMNTAESKPLQYDYSMALEVAKGDEELFLSWLMRFNEIVQRAKLSVEEAIESNNFPERNKDFHELINYAGYYGLSELKSHILELQSFDKTLLNKEIQKIFYLNIIPEIKNVLEFYSELSQTLMVLDPKKGFSSEKKD